MRKVVLDDLKTMAIDARGSVSTIYLHWTAGHYGQFFTDYHINVDADGSIYVSTEDLTERKSHTWRRNTGAVGVTFACCAYASTNDLGDYNRVAEYGLDYLQENQIPYEPPTDAQIESIAQVIAVLCKYLQIPIDENHVMTHAEAADLDEYGPKTTCERWDLFFLRNGDAPYSGGEILRGKANFYLPQVP